MKVGDLIRYSDKAGHSFGWALLLEINELYLRVIWINDQTRTTECIKEMELVA